MKKLKHKIKKAASGLQDIAVPEQGSYSDVASSATTMAASGAQFGPWGAVIGGALGLGAGLLNKNKQDAANRQAKFTNNSNKMNRSYAGIDNTVTQASQYAKGTKTIEIEGKKTPEIHTDSNFNVKNLGTVPHSKGGNKVEASEGDIVFNTQNSLAKYNKIASAIQEGDHTTLKKEQAKLPSDNKSKVKNPDGNNSIIRQGKKIPKQTMRDPAKEFLTGIGNSFLKGTRYSASYDPNTNKSSIVDRGAKSTSAVAKTSFADSSQNLIPQVAPQPKPKFDNRGGYVLPYNPKSVASIKSSTKVSGKKTTTLAKSNPNTAISQLGLNTPKLDTSISNTTIPTTLANKASSSATSANAGNITSKLANPNIQSSINNALGFAGVANNLYQGLKSERPLQENYVNPQLAQYTDRSQASRNQSTSMMNVQNSNARNLSGGLASNLRANMNASSAANSSRQQDINEREQSRADAINAQNVGIQNQAAELNAQRRDNYQQILMGNRAAKESFIGQAASDIGKYGMLKQQEGYLRSRDALADKANLAGLQALNGNSKFQFNTDGTNTFNPKAGNTAIYGRGRITKPIIGLDGNLDRDPKDDVQYKKGTKKIKIRK